MATVALLMSWKLSQRDLEEVYQRPNIGKQLQNVTKRQKVIGNDEFHYHKEWHH